MMIFSPCCSHLCLLLPSLILLLLLLILRLWFRLVPLGFVSFWFWLKKRIPMSLWFHHISGVGPPRMSFLIFLIFFFLWMIENATYDDDDVLSR